MMEQHNEHMKTIAELKQNFDKLMQINHETIANIPSDQMPNKTELMNDLDKIKKLVQKNDRNGLMKLLKKYDKNSQNAG